MDTRRSRGLTGWLGAAVAMAVLATGLRVWVAPAVAAQPSYSGARLPDSARQRQQMLEELKRMNALLGEIKELLANGTLNVHVRSADNPAPDAAGRPVGGGRAP